MTPENLKKIADKTKERKDLEIKDFKTVLDSKKDVLWQGIYELMSRESARTGEIFGSYTVRVPFNQGDLDPKDNANTLLRVLGQIERFENSQDIFEIFATMIIKMAGQYNWKFIVSRNKTFFADDFRLFTFQYKPL